MNRRGDRRSLISIRLFPWVGGVWRVENLFMSEKTLVDSNVLIYAHDADSPLRQRQVAECLKRLWLSQTGRMSTQVLQEFYVNVTQKIRIPMAKPVTREVVRNYGSWVHSDITPATVIRAAEISEIWKISFWDGMVFAAAEQSGASELLSEDLNDGLKVAGIRIVNSFTG
jgi:predicted nucleic acid-binding protein